MNNVKCKRIIAILLSVLLFISNFLFFSPNYIRSYAKEDIEIENSYDYSEESDSEIKTDNDISTEEELSITNDETSEENDELSEESTELTDDTEELLEESTELTDDTEELLEENTELTDDTEELSEENTELTEKLDLTMPSNISILQSGIYGYELNKQGTKIGVNTYIDGNLNASFNESILRFQTASVYCYDINKRFYETDDYTYHTERPDIFSQDDQDTIALIVYYFDNIVGTLDSRPAVQYYYTQCCLWNYIHSVNPAFNQYTTYIQVAECNKSNEEQQAIFDACMAWVNENKSNYTTSMQYWTNNEGDYQPVLHTNAFYEEKKGTISVNKSSANVSITNGNDNYSLQGAVYGIYLTQEDASNDSNRVTTITTDELGHGESEELSFATYYVKEITASKGYSLDTKIYTVTINSTVKSAIVSSAESPDSGKISLVKSSSNTSISNGNSNYTLQGAVYGVYKSETNAKNNTDKVASITTDEEGKGEVTGLSYGTYYVKEITASKGYSLDTKIYTVTINSTVKSATVSSAETPDSGKISLVKSSSNTSISNGNSNYTLQGAVYGVYKSETNAKNNTDKVASITTDEEGKGEVTGLSYGTYYVKEITASKGYSLDTKIYTVTINSTVKSAIVSSAESPDSGRISLVKSSSNTSISNGNSNYTLQGAVYGVYKSETNAKNNTDKVASITTDEEGKGEVTGLSYGTYYVKEITASKGYSLDTKVYTATINSTIKSATVSSVEKPNLGKISLIKASSDTSYTSNNSYYSLQGAIYGVYKKKTDANADINRVTSITTDVYGKGVSSDLPFGTYYVKEIKASKGYNLDSNIYETVTNETVQTATVSSSEKPDSGKIKVEKASSNTVLTKDNNCYSLQGAVYSVYRTRSDANAGTNRVTTITTDASGKGESGDLPFGKYYVKETQASKGYNLDSKVYEAEISSTVKSKTVSSAEIPQDNPIDIILKKNDSENKKPVEGAVYEIKYYAAETESLISNTTYRRHWYLKTDSDGTAKLNSLYITSFNKKSSDEFYFNSDNIPTIPLGYITIQEVESPVEYVMDDTTYTYKVTDHMLRTEATNKAVEPTISERPKKQAFQLIKLSEDGTNDLKPLANAGFMAWKVSELSTDDDGNYIFDTSKAVELAQDGSKEMFTDEDGYALSAELRYGTYIVKETTIPDGYNPVADFIVDVTIDSRTPQKIVYKTDTQKKYYLRITKFDSTTEHAVLNNSSAYRIWSYKDNDYVAFRTYTGSGFELVSEFNTGNDGILMTPGTLTYGDYRLEEITAPKGYNLDTPEGIDFTINDNTIYITTENIGDTVSIVDIVCNDTPVFGRYELYKEGEIRKWDEDSGNFITEVIPLADIEFGIYAGENIYTYDGAGTIIYEEGELAYTITTDAEGKAYQDGIPLGKYVVKELNTPDDFIKVSDIDIEFKIDDKKTDADGLYCVEQTSKLLNKAYYPKVKTTAVDNSTKEHTGVVGEEVTITDKVYMTDLVVGRTYLVKGKLYDTETGEIFRDYNGEEVTSELEFTAETVNQTVELEFTFDSTDIAGESITVFEELYYNDEKVALHADISDTEQQIHYVDVKTTAVDTDTLSHTGVEGEKSSIIDYVKVTNLVIGKEYTIKGKLYNSDTGEVFLDDDKEVTAEKTFTADKKDMTVELEFTFDSTSLAGETIVVFEDLYHNEIKVASHADLEDKEQHVSYPSVSTKAMDKDTNSNSGAAKETAVITDTVECKKLVIGEIYTIKGSLHNTDTGEVLLDNGKEVIAEKTIVAVRKNMTTELEFTFNSSSLAGQTTTVFEELYTNDIKVASHSDISDTEQQVNYPKIRTTAKDKATGSHTGIIGEEVTIIDEVICNNLIVGKEYTIKGKLYNSDTGEVFLDDGKEVTAEKIFTADKKDMTVELEFTFDSTSLAVGTIVVFEDLYHNEIKIASHADLEDKEQHVSYPSVSTKAMDKDTNSKSGAAKETAVITDTVECKNLVIGEIYTIKGSLHNTDTGEVLLDNGKEVIAEKTIIAVRKNMTTELEFTFNSSSLAGQTTTVFEELYTNDIKVASHSDISDTEQQVSYPKVRTTAKDKATGSHTGIIGEEVTIIDEVICNNLVIGKEYTLKGKLYNSDTSEVFLDEGKEVTAEKIFTADKKDMTVELEFTFDSTSLAGGTIVVFEDLYHNEIKIASHADLEDKGQQVHYPVIHTSFKEAVNGGSEVSPEESVILNDTVEISNITIGDYYIVRGIVYDKTTNDKLIINDKEIKGYNEFVSNNSEIMTDVTFTIDASGLAGKDIVCYEYLYFIDKSGNEILIAEHADINDEGQTIRFTKPTPPPTPPVPHTGDRGYLGIAVIFLVSLSSLIILFTKKNKYSQ